MNKFALGQVVYTQGVCALDLDYHTLIHLVARHQSGDWGDIDPDDAALNEAALAHDEENTDTWQGARVMSVYYLPVNICIWIITEADRSATTVLLPSEY